MKTLPEILTKLAEYVSEHQHDLEQDNINFTDARLEDEDAIDGAVQAIAKELMGCLPEKTDNHRLYLVVGDKDKTEQEIRLYAQLRQDGHNKALDEVRARLTAFIGHKEK